MNKLLSAGFSRLWKSKCFWYGIILLPGFIVCSLFELYNQMLVIRVTPSWSDFTLPLDDSLYNCLLLIGIFISVFASLFLGTEYSDGTIRNKLAVGHGRTTVYLSCLTVCFVSSLLVYLASIAVTFALGLPLLGTPETPALIIVQKYACGVLMIAALSGLFTLLAMLITNKPVSVIVCIAVIAAFLLLTFLTISRLNAQETISGGYTMAADGSFVSLEPQPNPHYLTGNARKAYEFFRDLLPTGIGIQLLESGYLENSLQSCLCSVFVTAATTAGGVFAFQRKDLK